MNSQNQPDYALNLKIAITLLVLAGLVFGGFAFSQSNDDSNTVTINQETKTVNQQTNTAKPEVSPTSASSSEASPIVSQKDEAKGTVITVNSSEFGPMLFDDRGQAIYIWELENSSTAKCYGSCAKAWPPVLTDGAPIASTGVNNALLGTTQRTDGTTQVTYNNRPLYYYADEGPGEVKCHNIRTHGGLWWVIQPNGERAK